MVILDVYSKCLAVKYRACLCSKTALFTFLTTALSIVVPYFFAYSSGGFWLKHDTFYEQPIVNFRGEYMFKAITSNFSSPILCNNFPQLQQFPGFDRCSWIKMREIDRNFDGKMDEFKFSINVELEDLKILTLYLVLTMDYTLNTICPMQMQTAVIIQQDPYNFPTSVLNIDGHLEVTQLTALRCHSNKWNNDYNYSCIRNAFDIESYDIKRLIKNYSQRNISTHLANKYTSYNVGNKNSEFLLNVNIRFPEHRLYYIPGFWQVIKWSWIQYLSIFLIWAWILRKIKTYMFENRLLLFYEVSPMKKIR